MYNQLLSSAHILKLDGVIQFKHIFHINSKSKRGCGRQEILEKNVFIRKLY